MYSVNNSIGPVCVMHDNTAPEACDFCYEFLKKIQESMEPAESLVDTSYFSLLKPADIETSFFHNADCNLDQDRFQYMIDPEFNPMISGFDESEIQNSAAGELQPHLKPASKEAIRENAQAVQVTDAVTAQPKKRVLKRTELVPIPVELRHKNENADSWITRGALAGRQPVPVPLELRYRYEDDDTRITLSALKQRTLIPAPRSVYLPGESDGLMLTRGAITKRLAKIQHGSQV